MGYEIHEQRLVFIDVRGVSLQPGDLANLAVEITKGEDHEALPFEGDGFFDEDCEEIFIPL